MANSEQVKHRRGTNSEMQGFTPAVAELVFNIDTSVTSMGDGETSGGGVKLSNSKNTMLKAKTLQEALVALYAEDGFAIYVSERTSGNGGAGVWDYVDINTVVVNGENIIACTGVTTLALVMRLNDSFYSFENKNVVASQDLTVGSTFYLQSNEATYSVLSTAEYNNLTPWRDDIPLDNGKFARVESSKKDKVAELPNPFVIAHQGGVLIYPAHTIEAYRGCISSGVLAIEEDTQPLLDGGLACHHDNTVDDRTDGTGNIVDFSTMGFQGLKVDAQNWFGGHAYTDLKTVLFSEVLAEVGDQVVHVPEVKTDPSGDRVVSEVIRSNLERCTIVQANTIPQVQAAIDADIPAMIISSLISPQNLVDAGVEYVGLATNESDATIQEYIAAGVKVVMYTPNRHVDRDYFDALGVSGYFSDDPVYFSKEGYKLTSDPFKNRTYYHGHIGNNFDIETRGYFQNGGWGFPVRDVSKNFVLQGWGCPIEEDTYTIAGSITFDETLGGSESANIAFCATTDDNFQDSAASTEFCYHAIFRASGLFILYRMEGGTYTSLGSTQMDVINQGDTITFTIDVSSSQIVITRTDSGAPNQHSTNDTTYRGGYFHFGRNTAGVTFKDISIT